MQLDTFRVIIKEYTRAGGVSFIDTTDSDDTEIDRVILRGLKDFTRHTLSLYDTTVTFTTVASTMTYPLSGLFQVDHIEVNEVVLQNYGNRLGAESRYNFYERHPNWRNDPLNQPTVYMMHPPASIWLFPIPDAAYVVNIAGYREHSDFTLGTAGSGITLDIEDHVSDIAAMWVAMKLKYPHFEGEALFEQITFMDQMAAAKIQDYKIHNMGVTLGSARRRGSIRRYYG